MSRGLQAPRDWPDCPACADDGTVAPTAMLAKELAMHPLMTAAIAVIATPKSVCEHIGIKGPFEVRRECLAERIQPTPIRSAIGNSEMESCA